MRKCLLNMAIVLPVMLSSCTADDIYESGKIELEFNEKDPDNPLGLKLFETNPSVTGIWYPQYGMTYDSGAGNINVMKGSDVYQIYPGKLGFESGIYIKGKPFRFDGNSHKTEFNGSRT